MISNPDITAIRQPGKHNQDQEKALIEYEAMRQKVLRKIENDPPSVINNCYSTDPEQKPRSVAPEYRCVRSSMYRKRTKQVLQFQKVFQFHGRWKRTFSGAQYLRYRNPDMGVTIFVTDESLQILSESGNVLSDRTFKCAPCLISSSMSLGLFGKLDFCPSYSL